MPTVERKSALNIVMGAMTFGEPGTLAARVHDIKDVEEMLEVFQAHGHTEIDTARVYAAGTSEEFLGKLDLPSKGFKLETKLYALKALGLVHDEEVFNLQPLASTYNKQIIEPQGIRKHIRLSLEALNVSSLEMWYLHAPDRSVPYEVTLKVVNDLYNEGLFKRFGISNYMSWEVAEIVGICRANNYVMPTAYQGVYNAIHRGVEPELLPCLRKFGISFYAFNPLGGGFFTGRYRSIDDAVEPGSRFDNTQPQGKLGTTESRYWIEPYFEALASIKEVADKHGLTLPEVALRWMSHHSQLKDEYGDSVLIGASNLQHIKQNLIDLEKGHLPEEVVHALDNAWTGVKAHACNYYH